MVLNCKVKIGLRSVFCKVNLSELDGLYSKISKKIFCVLEL